MPAADLGVGEGHSTVHEAGGGKEAIARAPQDLRHVCAGIGPIRTHVGPCLAVEHAEPGQCAGILCVPDALEAAKNAGIGQGLPIGCRGSGANATGGRWWLSGFGEGLNNKEGYGVEAVCQPRDDALVGLFRRQLAGAAEREVRVVESSVMDKSSVPYVLGRCMMARPCVPDNLGHVSTDRDTNHSGTNPTRGSRRSQSTLIICTSNFTDANALHQ